VVDETLPTCRPLQEVVDFALEMENIILEITVKLELTTTSK
jgi:hypothetical protein